MSVRISEWMKEWMGKRMCVLINEWLCEWMNGVCKWMNIYIWWDRWSVAMQCSRCSMWFAPPPLIMAKGIIIMLIIILIMIIADHLYKYGCSAVSVLSNSAPLKVPLNRMATFSPTLGTRGLSEALITSYWILSFHGANSTKMMIMMINRRS